jgi:hypothetical protein
MTEERKGRGRPKKPVGTRVQDQLHMGFRFDAETAAKLRAVLDRANAQLRASELPPLTAYALVRHWISEKIDAEFELQEPGASEGAAPARARKSKKG